MVFQLKRTAPNCRSLPETPTKLHLMHPEKSHQLSIQLTQPVVPLRCRPTQTSRHHDGEMLPPAIVRGLLTLKLAKPTKVSSIELELQAGATTHYCTPGTIICHTCVMPSTGFILMTAAGRTRIDVTEQYKVHSASMVVFKAGPMSQPQRAASARPRVQFLDVHSGSVAQHGARRRSGQWESPLDPQPLSRSISPDPRFLRVSQHLDTYEVEADGGRIPREDRVGSAPSKPISVHSLTLIFRVHLWRAGHAQSPAPVRGSRGRSVRNLFPVRMETIQCVP